jgi:uncharacterized protein (TIGR03790 family)
MEDENQEESELKMIIKHKPILLFVFLLLLQAPVLLAQSADNVLILVNENSADSKAIARYYAEKRKLPDINVCRIRTTEAEVISRDLYEREILKPVAKHLKSNQLQDQILYIVTTRGIPLAVAGTEGPNGDHASVDSELTLVYHYLLFGTYEFNGRVENPYFSVEFERENFRPFLRRDYDIYLVTRLAGYSAIDSALLVDRAVSPEAGGTFSFDLASTQQTTEADWLKRAASSLEHAGLKVTLEQTGIVLNDLVGVQGYVNQGSADLTSGGRIPRLQWLPGAIVTIFDKITAKTFQRTEPKQEDWSSGNMAAQYVENGATGFGGYIADPTIDGYIRPQILFPAYAAGYNLAEAYYAATRYISWRQVVVGDPLASPYQRNSTKQRATVEAYYHPKVDAETGLPEHFSQRRKAHLVQKYTTKPEAVVLLLLAEAAIDKGEEESALFLASQSLRQDPYIVESHLLKAEVLEHQLDFENSFVHYAKALELGKAGPDLYLKLARMALENLKDPKRAAPYAQWLYRSSGTRDPEIARLYAEVELQNGRVDQAKAVYHRLASENNPQRRYALTALGRISYDQGNLDLAKSFLSKALDDSDEIEAEEDDAKTWDRAETQELLEAIQSREPESKTDTSVTVSSSPSVSGDNDSRPARDIKRTPIIYPEGARLAGNQGMVLVKLLIDEMGQLVKSEVIRGDRRFARAVLESVKQWHFQPKLVRGRPEIDYITLSFQFQLKKPE